MLDQTVSTDARPMPIIPKGFEGLRILADFLVRGLKFMEVDLFSIAIDGYEVYVKKVE